MLAYLRGLMGQRDVASVSVRFVGEHAATTYTMTAADAIGVVLAPDRKQAASAYPWHMIASIQPTA